VNTLRRPLRFLTPQSPETHSLEIVCFRGKAWKRTTQVNQQLAPLAVDNDGTISLEVDELSRIELPLGARSGYLLMGGQRTALPIGSALQN